MRIIAEDLRPASGESTSNASIQSRPVGLAPAAAELLACLRDMKGWVSPEGLAPRAAFDRLVEAGLLEAWPGRPLYRARAGVAR